MQGQKHETLLPGHRLVVVSLSVVVVVVELLLVSSQMRGCASKIVQDRPTEINGFSAVFSGCCPDAVTFSVQRLLSQKDLQANRCAAHVAPSLLKETARDARR